MLRSMACILRRVNLHQTTGTPVQWNRYTVREIRSDFKQAILLNQLHIIIVHESQWMTSRNLQQLYPGG